MHDFKYKDNDLLCESVKLKELARHYGTPLYVYSHKTIIDHFNKLKTAFKPLDPLICYSVKANFNLSICKALLNEGAGFDIVSGAELFRVLKIGANPAKIVYAGVGKTEREIEFAVRNNVFLLNAESIPELKMIDKVASWFNKKQSVAIRINPNVKPKTHKYIATGDEENKFGVDLETARSIFNNALLFPNLDIAGVHIHIGSQIVESGPFIKAVAKIVNFIQSMEKDGIRIKWLDIGGGLGIIYSGEKPQTAEEYKVAITPLLKKVKAKIILEPGRFIVGNAGVLLTKVLYIKETRKKNFAIIDAGMNDLIRPSLYGAYHEVLPIESVSYGSGNKVRTYDVVGPICESGDFIAKNRKFIGIKEGDLLAVMSAGAYGFSMSSNYNSRPRAAEVMVSGVKSKLIRKRETYEDLLHTEVFEHDKD